MNNPDWVSNPLACEEIAHLHLQQVQVLPPKCDGTQRYRIIFL